MAAHLRSPIRKFASALLASALASCVGASSSGSVAFAEPVSSPKYSAAQRDASLRRDAETITGWVGSQTRIDQPGDWTALLGKDYGILEDGVKSYENVGVLLFNHIQLVKNSLCPPDIVTAGFPSVLLYAPESLDDNQINSGEPYHAIYPYHLVGWIYLSPYAPDLAPITHGLDVSPDDWFVFERSVFALPWLESYPQPPDEDWLGQNAGRPDAPLISTNPTGFAHGRFWALPIFLDPKGGAPKISGFDPFEYIPGEPDSQSGFSDSFFKPEHSPRP